MEWSWANMAGWLACIIRDKSMVLVLAFVGLSYMCPTVTGGLCAGLSRIPLLDTRCVLESCWCW